uniref:Carboxylesterase type B domain-containing protein n=1 Tax=Parascaris equorum TaxID=6256 RepID=A0A914S507_PAREQ
MRIKCFVVTDKRTGQIRGRHVITSRNTSGYVFLGIPYAEPPLGELRYRAPRPVRPWKGTIVVNDYKTSCLWNSTITSNIPEFTRMSEDCLTVNVFTNEKCLLDGGCAVVYMIHGGEYNFDSPMLYRIDFLLTVSPLTEGLFHRAIIMSALLGIPIPPSENFHNKDAEAVENVLNCLRKVDAKKLLDVQRDIEDSGFTFQGPCVDGPDGVLPERVEELLKTARPIKMMIGTVGKEMQNTDYLVCADGSVDREGVRAVCSAVAVWYKISYALSANKTPYILDDPCFFVNSALYSEALTKGL